MVKLSGSTRLTHSYEILVLGEGISHERSFIMSNNKLVIYLPKTCDDSF